MPLTGAWARRTVTPPVVPVHPEIDPQHSTPDANPEFVAQPPTWINSTPMPGLPGEILTQPGYPQGLIAPGGPVNRTPLDHDFGPGAGAGITQQQAQELRGYWQGMDLGVIAHESDVPVKETENMYGLAEVDDMIGNGDSPQTLEYERTGVGRPNDPDARRGKRQKRWSERYIDMHRWEVHPPPYDPQYAVPQPAIAADPNGNQYTRPFANNAAGPLGTVDSFVQQQIRRAPEGFGDAYAQDGTPQNIVGSVNAFGLPAWGL